MAHKGKAYEVWFRRDFSINRLNRDGWARRYTQIIGGFSSTSYGGRRNFQPLYHNNQKGPGDTRVWTSDSIAFAGVHYVFEMTVTNDPNDGWTDTIIKVFTDVTFLACVMEFKQPESPSYDYQSFSTLATRVLLQTPIMTADPLGVLGCTTRPWLYVDGP